MLVSVLLLSAACAAWTADKLPKPDRIVAPPTSEQRSLISEGIALHDHQKYQEAIAKYKQVLAENPWEVTTLYELSYTYFVSKDFENAIATARLGAQCKSALLPQFYMTMANSLDEMGRPGDAISLYKAAIKKAPSDGLLHYNLALTLLRQGMKPEAKAEVERGLFLSPNHASSHAILGSLYQQMGYRVPAILAYSRFLTLESDTQRAVETLRALAALVTEGVTKGKESNAINILLSAPSKSQMDEGDFMGAEMGINISLAADTMLKPEETGKQPKSDYEKLVSIYNLLGDALSNSKPKGGFAAQFYAPYFAALAKAEHIGAFVAETWKVGNVPGASEWKQANQAKIDAFAAWSKAYVWPVK